MSTFVSSARFKSLARFKPIMDRAASLAAAWTLAEDASRAVAAAMAVYLADMAWSGDLDCADETFRFLNFVEPPGVIIALFWA